VMVGYICGRLRGQARLSFGLGRLGCGGEDTHFESDGML
jgi:hypothetical protein